jgi:hypothetical protein
MPKLVVQGALLRCSQGTAPSSLAVVPHGVQAASTAAATVADYAPGANILPFGMCNSTLNPQVQMLIMAAAGKHTPAPCQPLIAAGWSPGGTRVKIRQLAALSDDSTCQCSWNGKVEITSPGPPGMKVGEK